MDTFLSSSVQRLDVNLRELKDVTEQVNAAQVHGGLRNAAVQGHMSSSCAKEEVQASMGELRNVAFIVG